MSESACSFGFEDLFHAAHGRRWTEAERRELEQADQPRRNALVRRWAASAGDVTLEDRLGTDGLLYTAFGFRRPPWWSRIVWRPPHPGEPAIAVTMRAGGAIVPGKAVAVAVVRHPGEEPAGDGVAVIRHGVVAAADDLERISADLADYLRCPSPWTSGPSSNRTSPEATREIASG